MRTNTFPGKTVNRLTAIRQDGPKNKKGNCRWLFICSCGTTISRWKDKVAYGRTKSCGCLPRENRKLRPETYPISRTPEYKTWQNMRTRCFYQKHIDYQNYGARGITVCDRWNNSFDLFILDMGPKPTDGINKWSIDRINNDGNYEPGNCRWVTSSEQRRNTSRNKWITAFGKTMCLGDWAREVGISAITIWHRINKQKRPPEIALTEKPRGWKKRRLTQVQT